MCESNGEGQCRDPVACSEAHQHSRETDQPELKVVPLTRKQFDPVEAEVVKMKTWFRVQLVYGAGGQLFDDPKQGHDGKDNSKVD